MDYRFEIPSPNLARLLQRRWSSLRNKQTSERRDPSGSVVDFRYSQRIATARQFRDSGEQCSSIGRGRNAEGRGNIEWGRVRGRPRGENKRGPRYRLDETRTNLEVVGREHTDRSLSTNVHHFSTWMRDRCRAVKGRGDVTSRKRSPVNVVAAPRRLDLLIRRSPIDCAIVTLVGNALIGIVPTVAIFTTSLPSRSNWFGNWETDDKSQMLPQDSNDSG